MSLLSSMEDFVPLLQKAYSPMIIREVKHDVYGRRQTAKITSDFLFFSCNP